MEPTLWIRNAAQVLPMDDAFSVVAGGAVVCAGDRIAWVGREGEWPDELAPPPDAPTVDAGGGVVLPGLIDCHTHAVFAGSRAHEFAARLDGATYEEILAAGGGILGTVRNTREATVDELVALARPRLDALASGGVTTIEVKSGYGLEEGAERRMLEAVRELGVDGRWELVPTFLGAHTVPPEFSDDREGYLTRVLDRMLPEVAEAGLARFCDVFCEPGLAFDVDESRRVLSRARELGLGIKIHADQLSAGGAPSWRVRWAPSRPNTWSTPPTPVSLPWPARAPSRPSSRAPTTSSARPPTPRWSDSVSRGFRWRWPRT